MSKVKRTVLIITVSVALLLLAATAATVFYLFRYATTVRDLKCTDTTYDTAVLTWNESDIISGAVLVISDDKNDTDILTEEVKNGGTVGTDIPSGLMSATADDLLPAGEYYGAIVPYINLFGRRYCLKPSNTAKIKTEKLTVPSPTDIEVTVINDTSVKIKWDLPQTDDAISGKELAVLYRIEAQNGTNTVMKKEGFSHTETVFDGLNPLTEYSFKATAYTEIGGREYESKTTESKTVRTPPSSPKGVNATKSDVSSITVIWDPCSDKLPNKSIVTYGIFTSDSEDGDYALLEGGLHSCEYVDTGLESDTERYYKVEVTVTLDGENFKSALSNAARGKTQVDPKKMK